MWTVARHAGEPPPLARHTISALPKEHGVLRWLVGGFSGLVVVAAAMQLFSGRTWLRLDLEGFEQAMLGRRMQCRWDEVSDFGTWSMRQGFFTVHRGVAFDRPGDEGKVVARMNRAIAGGTTALGDTFGMRAEDLAALRNAFRERALKGA